MTKHIDYVLYFGPKSIWTVEFDRRPGWWAITQPDRQHKAFTGPFHEEESAHAWLREEYEGREPLTYTDPIIGTPMTPERLKREERIHETLTRLIYLEAESNIEHGKGGMAKREAGYVGQFVSKCLQSILTDHPRSDLRVILRELADELA